MKSLIKLSSALAGLLIILISGLLQSAIVMPTSQLGLKLIDLPSSWQVPGLLLVAVVCGPKSGLIATFAYLTIGLFYLPVFHGGGSIGYIATPDFGYLLGFIPAVWVTGRLTETNEENTFFSLFISIFIGLSLIHTIGLVNIFTGTLLSRWPTSLIELIITYSLSTFPTQLLLCPAIVFMAKILRKILLIE
ncbi:biotin transporter BioY [Prochlorococcus marinus]|uniref:biotin transporter BioY n=1 Tax=Prochlorococcus marinus TaxID=1219 RepID=UPI0022B4C38A|nr:biotin transporter BioY [Prochlorococcus marinus]